MSGSWPSCLWEEHSFEFGKCSYFWPLALRLWHHDVCMVSWWSRLTGDSLQGNRGIGIFFKVLGCSGILCSPGVRKLCYPLQFLFDPFAEVLHKTDVTGLLKACSSSPVSTDVGSNLRVTYSSSDFSVELYSLTFAFSIVWKELRLIKKNSTNFLAQDGSFISLLSLSVFQKQSQLHHS